ncbi:MAG TPA: hypothetical protein VGN01_07885 [Acidobacteriaceae bacterium]|jgi:hypothetical protein
MQDHSNADPNVIHLPRPTAWPLVLALGISLGATGLVTSAVIGVLGLLLSIAGIVGWFLQVLPHEQHEGVAVTGEEIASVSVRTLAERERRHPESDTPRTILPVETFRITTGIRGGIAGGIAMTVPAGIFSVVKYHSFWYAVNLLAAGGFVSWAGASDTFLGQFHMEGLLAAIAIHGFISLLVGLLYGAMLPMFPRYPIVTAGFMTPLIMTGILYSAIGIVSPILDERIDWFWFILSMIAYGLVCGYVVNLQAKVRTRQFQALPFSVRAGLHTDQPDHPQEKDSHS